mmetsp:Transcript_11208/g.35260  ORF Transcript_11208/g.35260 Transcript_11208/m.35260 type:complete len:215 (-) Transcript_11208:141-785(-)
MERWLASYNSGHRGQGHGRGGVGGSGSGGGGGSGNDRKRQRGNGEPSAAGRGDLLHATADLALHTARTQRQMMGMLQTTFPVPQQEIVKSALAVSPVDGDDRHTEQVMRWAALILALSASSEASDDEKRILRAHVELYRSPLALAPLVQSCICQPIHYNPSSIRVQWVVSADLHEISSIFHALLVKHGGVMKFSPPPRSTPERAVAKALAGARR